jgi:hypothetical protein
MTVTARKYLFGGDAYVPCLAKKATYYPPKSIAYSNTLLPLAHGQNKTGQAATTESAVAPPSPK